MHQFSKSVNNFVKICLIDYYLESLVLDMQVKEVIKSALPLCFMQSEFHV